MASKTKSLLWLQLGLDYSANVDSKQEDLLQHLLARLQLLKEPWSVLGTKVLNDSKSQGENAGAQCWNPAQSHSVIALLLGHDDLAKAV